MKLKIESVGCYTKKKQHSVNIFSFTSQLNCSFLMKRGNEINYELSQCPSFIHFSTVYDEMNADDGIPENAKLYKISFYEGQN